MARFQRTATQRVSQALRTATGRRRTVLSSMLEGDSGQGMLWSRDNPTAHDADLEDLGISTDDYCPLPPASGDFHRVIEHAHGTLFRAFQAWLLRQRTLPEVETMKRKLTSLFYQLITPEHVASDMAKLPGLWRAVREAGGEYVANKWW